MQNDIEILSELEHEIGVKLKQHRHRRILFAYAKNCYSLDENNRITGLNIRDNKISIFPEAVTKLKHLQKINIEDNRISEISDSIKQLENLQDLLLDSNMLPYIPKAIFELKNLQSLNLKNNKIEKIPDEIQLLKKLKYIVLSENNISYIPDTVASLSSLILFRIKNNKIETFPASCLKIKSLKYLQLDGNKIREIPKEITDSNLEIFWEPHFDNKGIFIGDNPMVTPPLEIIKRGKQQIKNYFDEIAGRGISTLNEVKLVLIGEGRVGKTSVAKALTQSDYYFDEDEKTTEGIDITNWKINSADNSHRDYYINVWDFGGQEIYHTTHQFFLTKRTVYLLVTESRKEDKHDDFYYWLNIVKLLGDNSPVIIVQNKIDQPVKDLPVNEYKKAFTNITGIERVSCLPDYTNTIKVLKDTIFRVICDKQLMPHIGSPMPVSWKKIRTQLENLKQEGKNYIDYSNYAEICKTEGIEKDKAIYLSEFFHDIGIILHFHDEWDLRDTVFLDHEYVTNAVYKVLDNPYVIENRGVFEIGDLEKIWTDKKLISKRRELLALMKNKRFDLCFEIDSNRFLIPNLLPVDEIDFEWRTEDNNLHFEYRYRFMPKGILTRFIVKRHVDIYKKTYWRYGVLLNYKNTRAIIREKYFDRKISIILEGDNKRNFLGIIRKTFEEIHHDFNRLEVMEMIPCNCSECKQAGHPYFYRNESLERRLNKGKKTVECDKSFELVNIDSLYEGVGNQKLSLKQTIKELIANDQLKLALDKLEDLITKNQDYEDTDFVYVLKNRYNRNQKAFDSNTINLAEFNLEKNKIIKAILEFLD